MKKLSKKQMVIRKLKNSKLSHDMIALKCECEISYVNRVEKELKRDEAIKIYERNIETLNEMKKLYELCDLNGGFYSDMMDEIDSQINHCSYCIKNLTK